MSRAAERDPHPTRSPTAPPPGAAEGLRVAEEVYWRDYYLGADRHYEWNDGISEEKPVSDDETCLAYVWLVELLRHFLRADPVYADFVLSGWQETERQVAAERAARHLVQARAAAEAQARQEAERALAELRAQLASRRPD